MSKKRRDVIASHLDRMLKQPDFPAFSEHIQEVMVRAGDEETSLRQITNVILKDLSLTLKVLKTANSPVYNRSGRTILTVTHAVALLGLETIRDLAGSMMLFRHYRNFSNGLKELMLLSLLSASHAKVTSAKVHYKRSEEAYLCGMFRNLGEVLVSCYLPKSYSEILVKMQEHSFSERKAAIDVLGCTFEDLGEAAARHWNMPDKVSNSIQGRFPRLTKSLNSDSEMLEALTSFSHGLTAAIYRKGPEGIRARLNHLIETHGTVLSIRLDEIQEITEAAITETKATFDLLHVPLDDLKLSRQIDGAMETLGREAEPEADNASVENLSPGPTMLTKLTGEVEALVLNGANLELTNAILMVLEAIYRGVPFDRVLFGLVAPDHSVVRGRLGLGHRIDELLETFQYPMSAPSGPVGVALLGKQDLWVTDDRFPDWEPARLTGARAYGLYPVIVDSVVVGCLYMETDQRMRLQEKIATMVCRLRDLTGTAIGRKRAEADGQVRFNTSLPTPSE